MKKNIDDYSHDELIKLSNEELSKLLEKNRLKEKNVINNFEQEIYPKYTFEEKVEYWGGRLHRQMRWQCESGLDEYSIYDKEWYESTKEIEPDFDKIMEEVIKRYWGFGADWSKEEYFKRIGK